MSPSDHGTPDWIRTSGLQRRSYQAVKPESPAGQGFGWCYTNFRHSEEKPRKPYRARLPRFFAAECTLNCKVEIRFLIIFNVSPYCLFPDDENRKFSVYYMELAPGSHWQSEPHLRGTTEFVTLFAGAIEITADQKAIVVQASESVRFQGDTTHTYRNISDQTTILHMILYNP
ncbi:MAG: cupin domain-containing protein [Firmicutes bacterium]|nr:cupin domain-containing protein [Bacillota bacterium]